MSTGQQHAEITAALIIPTAVASMLLFRDDPLLSILAGAIGCATGLIIEPDLDIDDLTASEWKMIKKLWIVGMLWVAFWYPYAKAIPHRSPFSHFPLLGTFGRVAYLLGLLWFFAAIVGVSVPIMQIVSQPVFVVWFFGLAVADTAHFIMDVISTKFKRMVSR